MEDVSWKLIDKYFQDNPHNLVAHHLDKIIQFVLSKEKTKKIRKKKRTETSVFYI